MTHGRLIFFKRTLTKPVAKMYNRGRKFIQ